jgi:hypothetical protein
MASEPRLPGRAEDDTPDDGRVPLFGSWPIAYAAVIACAVVVMALVALFSWWPY